MTSIIFSRSCRTAFIRSGRAGGLAGKLVSFARCFSRPCGLSRLSILRTYRGPTMQRSKTTFDNEDVRSNAVRQDRQLSILHSRKRRQGVRIKIEVQVFVESARQNGRIVLQSWTEVYGRDLQEAESPESFEVKLACQKYPCHGTRRCSKIIQLMIRFEAPLRRTACPVAKKATLKNSESDQSVARLDNANFGLDIARYRQVSRA